MRGLVAGLACSPAHLYRTDCLPKPSCGMPSRLPTCSRLEEIPIGRFMDPGVERLVSSVQGRAGHVPVGQAATGRISVRFVCRQVQGAYRRGAAACLHTCLLAVGTSAQPGGKAYVALSAPCFSLFRPAPCAGPQQPQPLLPHISERLCVDRLAAAHR